MSKRSGYGGSVHFDYELERYIDTDTGEITNIGDPEDEDFESKYKVITVEVTGSAHYSPGNYFALPEDSYPDEYDVEIESVLDSNKKDWLPLLTKEERTHLELSIDERVQEACSEAEYDYYDDYDDYDMLSDREKDFIDINS